MQTLRVTHKPYSVFEIYHGHIQSIVLLNLMFTMLSTQISYKYHIYAQCSLKVTYKTLYYNSNVTMLSKRIPYNTIFMHNADFKSDP